MTMEHAARLVEREVFHLDAPVSGGSKGAAEDSLAIMAGGARAAFDRASEDGVWQTCKVTNQIIVALNIEAVGEALVFAKQAGAHPAEVREALMGGFAASKILEVHGLRMIERTFAPGFRIELHQKDPNLALQAAREIGVALPNTATAQELFNTCRALGVADWDHSGMVKALEHPAVQKVANDN